MKVPEEAAVASGEVAEVPLEEMTKKDLRPLTTTTTERGSLTTRDARMARAMKEEMARDSSHLERTKTSLHGYISSTMDLAPSLRTSKLLSRLRSLPFCQRTSASKTLTRPCLTRVFRKLIKKSKMEDKRSEA